MLLFGTVFGDPLFQGVVDLLAAGGTLTRYDERAATLLSRQPVVDGPALQFPDLVRHGPRRHQRGYRAGPEPVRRRHRSAQLNDLALPDSQDSLGGNGANGSKGANESASLKLKWPICEEQMSLPH